ncbi:hypothetical protein CYMTET_56724 [Cymbomonas tetramitiformis]|uniref:TLDc domain-containing protein n=1 Tax=Cymbomonas tetramitiformis TaxID=36881 RepID=A0AAE0BBS0_9CHLO|nr:hypothetical protein CYMTET_56724 [Cymbomonas tetramitiformis]
MTALSALLTGPYAWNRSIFSLKEKSPAQRVRTKGFAISCVATPGTGYGRGASFRQGAQVTHLFNTERVSSPTSRSPRSSEILTGGIFDMFKGKGGSDAKGLSAEDAEVEEEELPFPEDLLDGTFLQGRRLACSYRATRDGFSALTFHERCDFKGPSLVIARTDKGLRFGGFNPSGWASTDDYCDNANAFLFHWPAKAAEATILPKVGGPGAAIFDYARGGPQFGADGLIIGNPLSPVMGGFAGPESETTAAGSLTTAKSRLGSYYAGLPDGSTSLFGKSGTAVVVEVEVFYSPELASLY